MLFSNLFSCFPFIFLFFHSLNLFSPFIYLLLNSSYLVSPLSIQIKSYFYVKSTYSFEIELYIHYLFFCPFSKNSYNFLKIISCFHSSFFFLLPFVTLFYFLNIFPFVIILTRFSFSLFLTCHFSFNIQSIQSFPDWPRQRKMKIHNAYHIDVHVPYNGRWVISPGPSFQIFFFFSLGYSVFLQYSFFPSLFCCYLFSFTYLWVFILFPILNSFTRELFSSFYSTIISF